MLSEAEVSPFERAATVPSMSLWNKNSERLLGTLKIDNNKNINIYKKIKLQTSLWRMSITLVLYTCLRNLNIRKHAHDTKQFVASRPVLPGFQQGELSTEHWEKHSVKHMQGFSGSFCQDNIKGNTLNKSV